MGIFLQRLLLLALTERPGLPGNKLHVNPLQKNVVFLDIGGDELSDSGIFHKLRQRPQARTPTRASS